MVWALDYQTVELMFKKMGCKDQNIIATFWLNKEKYEEMGMKTARNVVDFIAQCAHESIGFKHLEENLYYTTAARIQKVFRKKRFPTLSSAQGYTRNPRKLANKVYNGRMGNKVGSDDGWNTRGSGFIHLTGMNNFTLYGDLIGVDLISNPEKAREIETALLIAVKYFQHRTYKGKNIWYYSDLGDTRRVSKMINGGTNGMSDRLSRTNKLLNLISNTNTKGRAISSQKRSQKPYEINLNKVLRTGSRGQDVINLQTRLNALKFNVGKADGIFGRGTKASVVRFQMLNGLIPDGIAGKQTLKVLFQRRSINDKS